MCAGRIIRTDTVLQGFPLGPLEREAHIIASCNSSAIERKERCRQRSSSYLIKVPDKPGSVYAIIYLGGRLPCRSSSLPAAIAGPASCILGLAPGGVCHALSIAVQAVVSYTAVSPLPEGGLFSAALSVALPLLAVSQHHRPVEPGLSSLRRLLQGP